MTFSLQPARKMGYEGRVSAGTDCDMDWQRLVGRLHRSFPNTAAAFATLPDGLAALGHIVELEEGFGRRAAAAGCGLCAGGMDAAGRAASAFEPFDVVLAGGGLSLIYAAALSRLGLRVCVFDRRRIGCGHREWNISRRELQPLVTSGLFTADEVQRLIRMQYRHGICRFGSGPAHAVAGVLDCVVDAEGLLEGLRQRALAAGATLLDYHAFAGYRVVPGGVEVEVTPNAQPARKRLVGRLLVDALGVRSPHARFDLLCPTVGGVMEGLKLGSGLDEMDPEVGEILVTTEGVEDGQQHVWEGFPARPSDGQAGAMTIYLFYYQRIDQVRAEDHPLLSLYERFFTTLPRYKRGPLRMVRPTYGYIPGYTRLGLGKKAPPASPCDRVLLVGDAAARHSPLTFCGFGSMIRSFWPVSQGIARLLAEDKLDRRALAALWSASRPLPGAADPSPPEQLPDQWVDQRSDQQVDPPALLVMGGLTLMMVPSPGGSSVEEPDGINQLLDAAFATLRELGEEVYAAFLQDRVDAKTFVRFMLRTSARHPAVYRKVLEHLTLLEAATWLLRLARFRCYLGPSSQTEQSASRRQTGRDNTGA